jgi:hypothetical protein
MRAPFFALMKARGGVLKRRRPNFVVVTDRAESEEAGNFAASSRFDCEVAEIT